MDIDTITAADCTAYGDANDALPLAYMDSPETASLYMLCEASPSGSIVYTHEERWQKSIAVNLRDMDQHGLTVCKLLPGDDPIAPGGMIQTVTDTGRSRWAKTLAAREAAAKGDPPSFADLLVDAKACEDKAQTRFRRLKEAAARQAERLAVHWRDGEIGRANTQLAEVEALSRDIEGARLDLNRCTCCVNKLEVAIRDHGEHEAHSAHGGNRA